MDVVKNFISDIRSSLTGGSTGSNGKDFDPIPYDFKIADSTAGNVEIKCPPFGVLLDHSIAVIWRLYAGREDLTIPQIEWTKKFLEGIPKQTRDLEEIIDRLDNLLINKYANEMDINKSMEVSSSQTISVTLKDMLSTNKNVYDELIENTIRKIDKNMGKPRVTLKLEENTKDKIENNLVKPRVSVKAEETTNKKIENNLAKPRVSVKDQEKDVIKRNSEIQETDSIQDDKSLDSD